jgi:hypothetical protein
MKGHLKSRSSKHHSTKLNTLSVRKPKQKLKNHKGLLKRIKIVVFRICRLDLVGIGSLSFNHPEKATWGEIKVEPTWWGRGRPATCTRPICLKSRSWSRTLRGNRWKWDIDINSLVNYQMFFDSIDFIREEKSFFLLPLTCRIRSRSWIDPPYMNISYLYANSLSGSCSSLIILSGFEKPLFTKVI